jgi:hypothetical protein
LRRALCSLILLASLLAARSAEARRYVPVVDYSPTPQWWAVELKFGPYRPDIDAEFDGASPYQDTFGGGVDLMSQLTVDVQFLKLHGKLGVGGTIGYFQAKGKALAEDGTASGDDTSLNMVPLLLQLVYRWDYAAERWKFPLVPYIRFGVVGALWWVEGGSGGTTSFGPDRKARGATWGYQLNIGIAFLLDVLEPTAAKRLDMELGVNHSYIFVEFVHSSIDDFGHENSWQLGMQASLLAGLTLEF